MDKIEKIVWTEDGINSFEEVIRYISRDSVYYASNFASKILFSIEKLPDLPKLGRVVPEYDNPAIRELIHQNYRIVYKVSTNSIHVLLVAHGTKSLPANM